MGIKIECYNNNLLQWHPQSPCNLLQLGAVAAVVQGVFWAISSHFENNQICPAIQMQDCQTPIWLKPYESNDRFLTPPIPTQIQESSFIHPGFIYLDNGAKYEIHDQNVDFHKSSENAIADLKNKKDIVKKNDEELDKALAEGRNLEGLADRSSFEAIRTIRIAKDIVKEMSDQIDANAHMRDWMEKIQYLSANEIIQNLIQSHDLLFRNQGPSLGLRKENVQVFDVFDRDRTEENWIELVKDRGTEEDRKIFKDEILPKFDSHNFYPRPVERQILKRLGLLCHFPPDYPEVPDLILDFGQKFKDSYMKMISCPSEFDPIGFAAWTHQKIGEIHPFPDGNGRIARMVMNNIMKIAGHPPVVFPTREDYTEAIKEDDFQTPGHFAQYVREKMIPWNRRQFDFQKD